MIIKSKDHISNSKQAIVDIMDEVQAIVKSLEEKQLHIQEAAGKWSILQCIKHMTYATKLYNKNISAILNSGISSPPAEHFKSHWKGDLFTKMISPKNNGAVKNNLKTFKSMTPKESLNAQETIDEFMAIHQELIQLMEQSNDFNLNKVKVNTALGPLVRLRLGDAFRFIIGHDQRHIMQLKRIKAAIS